MPEFYTWWLSVTAIVAILYFIVSAYLDYEEDKVRRAYKAVKARNELAELHAINEGTTHGDHVVVAKGPLNSGITYILCRTLSGDDVYYLLLLHDRSGLPVEVKSAQSPLVLEKRLVLPIGFHADSRIVYPASGSDGTWSPRWINLTQYVRLRENPYRDPEPTAKLLFDLAEERRKKGDELTSGIHLARVSAEVRQPLPERKSEVERWQEAEYWQADGKGVEGVVDRYTEAPPAHRAIIQNSMLTLLKQHERDIDRINFHALGSDARKLFLPAFLNIEVGGSTPIYDLDASSPGCHIYICRHGAANASAWRPYLPQINRYLGGTWRVQELDATRIQLTEVLELPAVLPFHSSYLAKGQVFCGIDVLTGDEVYVPLAKMTHTLVCGQTGSGKSVGLNQLKRSLLFNIDDIAEIAACDLKGGVDLARFAGLSPKISFIDSYTGMHDLAEKWVSIMKTRFVDMRAKGETNTTSNYRILIVDEFSEIGGYEPTKEEKPRHNKLIANLALLAQQGRAAGIRLILQTQAPTADYLPTTIMKNLPSVMCYRMNSRHNISAIFLGYGDALPSDPAAFRPGEYLFANGATGELTHVKTTACHEYDVEALKACLPTNTACLPTMTARRGVSW